MKNKTLKHLDEDIDDLYDIREREWFHKHYKLCSKHK